jgi:hypothetical protein
MDRNTGRKRTTIGDERAKSPRPKHRAESLSAIVQYLLAFVLAGLLATCCWVSGIARDPFSLGGGFFIALALGLARSQLEKADSVKYSLGAIFAGAMAFFVVLLLAKTAGLPPAPPPRAVLVYPAEADRIAFKVEALGSHENLACSDRLWFVVKDTQPWHNFYRVICSDNHTWRAPLVQFGGENKDDGCTFEAVLALAAADAQEKIRGLNRTGGQKDWPQGLNPISGWRAVKRAGSGCPVEIAK